MKQRFIIIKSRVPKKVIIGQNQTFPDNDCPITESYSEMLRGETVNFIILLLVKLLILIFHLIFTSRFRENKALK